MANLEARVSNSVGVGSKLGLAKEWQHCRQKLGSMFCVPLIEFGTTKTRTMHAEAATTAMMWRLQQRSILHPTAGASSAFCLHAINKERIEGGRI